jgi:predicted dithiol-disulfide oxidoreductase (DUF899 family)
MTTVNFPNESTAYRAARDRLLTKEIELRRAMEAVAAARRALPPGGEIREDYIFQGMRPDGTHGDVRLSELFAPDRNSLVIYSMMFPRHPNDDRAGPATGATARLPLTEGPCPSCTALVDQLDGAEPHVAPRVNMVIIAKAPLQRLLAFAQDRDWRHVRLLSSAHNAFNRDYGAETEAGHQQPMLNVFHRKGGNIRHFWGSEMLYAPTDTGQDPRHVGTIEPLWNIFDLVPEGRGGDWNEQLAYPCCVHPSA